MSTGEPFRPVRSDVEVELPGPAVPPELLRRLYELAFLENPWPAAMDLLSPSFATKKVLFVQVDRIHPRASVTEVIGLAPAHADALRHRDLGVDHLWHAMLALPAGQVFRSTELFPRQVLHSGPLYEQIAVPAGIEFVLGGILENGPAHFTDISFMRSSSDFDPAEKQLLAMLVPHLQTLLALNRRIAAGDAGRREALRSFDRARQPLVVLDRSGYAIYRNESAHRFLDRADGVQLKFGRFLFDSVVTQIEFERVVRLALSLQVDSEPMPQKIRVSRVTAGSPYGLNVIPVHRPEDRALLPDGAGCMILIYDDEGLKDLPVERLAWLYRLTGAEARICKAIYHQGSVESAARSLNLTQHTVRSHLKSIYTKLGVGSQGQLMIRLANSVRLTEGVDRPELVRDG